ncbi:MAG: M90 family metallopeptidase [Verrucomicrobiales bacterium]
MNYGWLILIVLGGLAVALGPLVRGYLHRRRREQLLAQPFPEEWIELLRMKWWLYERLPAEVRNRLHGCIHVLLDEKRFEACGGLAEISDEMRILIAAQAALLLVGRPGNEHRFYPDLVSILVYPGSFRDKGRRTFSLHEAPGDVRLGESGGDSVVLSWHSVRSGAAGKHGGLNVVFHEFAHQIDQADGDPDGAPGFDEPEDAARWSEVFRQSYDDLVEEVAHGGDPLLDEYAATDPAEFFAVTTETFFERPRDLDREMPDVYDELADFYGLDPVNWRKGG